MQKNLKPTPKVRESIGADRVHAAIEDLTRHIESHFDVRSPDTVLVGIQTRGATLAQRVSDNIKQKKKVDLPVGAIDITLYRDDFSTSAIQPSVGETNLNFDLDGKNVILIDDVLFTGRTIRAALDELMDFGRPKKISLVVLVDRGHRELPIQADFAAMKLATQADESVNLHLTEIDRNEQIVICEPLKE